MLVFRGGGGIHPTPPGTATVVKTLKKLDFSHLIWSEDCVEESLAEEK